MSLSIQPSIFERMVALLGFEPSPIDYEPIALRQ
jgi:hypothetical protein